MSKISCCLLLCLASLSFACSDAPTSGVSVDAGVPDSGGPHEYAYCDVYRIACQRQAECGVAVLNNETTAAACEALANCEAVLEDALANLQVVRPADVTHCAQTLESATCQSLANNHLRVDAACFTIHAGTKKANEACNGAVLSECEPGLTCDASTTCPGVCRPPAVPCVEGSCDESKYCSYTGECVARVAENGACEFPTFEGYTENSCTDGLYCSDNFTCVPQLALDAACTGSTWAECVPGAACINFTCQTALQQGATCEYTNDCAAGLFCDFTDSTCQPRGQKDDACAPSVGSCDDGLRCHIVGACTSDLDCDPGAHCCGGSNGAVCTTDATCAPAGLCVPAIGGVDPLPLTNRPVAESGGRCDDSVCPIGEICRCENEACANHVCKPGAAMGQSCVDEEDTGFDPLTCSHGMCDFIGSKRCVTPKAEGESCSSSEPTVTYECLTGLCANKKCISSSMTVCQP